MSLAANNTFYSIKPEESKTGIYIEELGKIRTFYTDWKLVTYINLSTYNEDYKFLQSIIKRAENLCQQDTVSVVYECETSLHQMDRLMNEINEYDTKWFVKTNNTQIKRTKRGLINIIGSVSKALFGTLSEDDANYYLTQFQNLKSTDVKHSNIIKRQTSLIESAIHTMNVTFSRQNYMFQRFVDFMMTKI